MKPDSAQLAELNVRIAERLGYSFRDEGWRYPDDPDWQQFKAVYRGDGFVGLQKPEWSQVPDFTGSLDVINEAILALTGTPKARKHDLHMIFAEQLYRVLAEQTSMPGTYEFATADALTLCIALYRTLSEKPIL